MNTLNHDHQDSTLLNTTSSNEWGVNTGPGPKAPVELHDRDSPLLTTMHPKEQLANVCRVAGQSNQAGWRGTFIMLIQSLQVSKCPKIDMISLTRAKSWQHKTNRHELEVILITNNFRAPERTRRATLYQHPEVARNKLGICCKRVTKLINRVPTISHMNREIQ